MKIINIGLNVGTKQPKKQLSKTLEAIRPKKIKVVKSKYLDITEKTVICKTELSEKNLQSIAKILQQECIAVFDTKKQKGKMIYNHEYKGEKINFDINYFKF